MVGRYDGLPTKRADFLDNAPIWCPVFELGGLLVGLWAFINRIKSNINTNKID